MVLPSPAVSAQPSGGFESQARSGPSAFPSFDGLRAIAALAVLVTHAAYVTGATGRMSAGAVFARLESGVAVFFAISGFLLYRPFAAAHLAGTPDVRPLPFWRRRVMRIFPAYWVALTFVPLVLGRRLVHGLGDVVIYYGLLQVYDGSRVLGGLPQAWSLCTELAFYGFLPLYAYVLARGSRPPERQLRREVVGVVVLYALSVGFRVSLLAVGWDHPYFTWLPAWLDVFALGMGLGVASAWTAHAATSPSFVARVGRHPGICWLLAGAALLASSAIGLPLQLAPITADRRLLGQFLYGVMALALLLPATFGPSDHGWVRRLLRSRVLVQLGLVSYGIYLWHLALVARAVTWTGGEPIAASFLPVLAVGLFGTVVVAAVSYAVIEKPVVRAGGDATAPRGR
jgi:peptidoglycan/LPS O-acetylase OafA/YrhL